jgi:ankyrin repeat protein
LEIDGRKIAIKPANLCATYTSATANPTAHTSDCINCSMCNNGQKISQAAILLAVMNGDIAKLEDLVRRGAHVENALPLSYAASRGELNLVHCLVRKLGANVNQRIDNGMTSLFCAAQQGHLNVVRCLVLEHGADVHLGMHDGFAPLLTAAQEGHLNVVQCLLELGANVNQ